MSLNSLLIAANSTDVIINWKDPVVKNVMYFVNNLETPIYFIVGLFSRLLSLLSIYRETKAENAYLYQVHLLIAELFEILFQFFAQLSQRLRQDYAWFQQCYACMFWDRHLSNIFASGTKANANILTLTMTVDRVFALWKPMKYKTSKNGPVATGIRKWLPLVSILIGLAINIPFGFIVELQWNLNTGVYDQIVTNVELTYVYGLYSGVFDLALIIANIVASVLLCYFFRRVIKNRAKVKHQSSAAAVENSTAKDDRTSTLFKMTFCHSFCNTFASLITVLYRNFGPLTAGFLSLEAFRVFNCLRNPIITASTELMDILEFFLMLAISGKFRAMVIRTAKNIRCGKKKQQNKVTTVQVI